jgi:hypothetical protein
MIVANLTADQMEKKREKWNKNKSIGKERKTKTAPVRQIYLSGPDRRGIVY